MSESDVDIILPSSQELDKAVEEEENKKVLESDSVLSEDDSGKENKSAKRLQRSGVLMLVPETEKEFKYRKKEFKDPDDVITNRKLRCTACCVSLQSLVLDGRDVYHHPVLKVLMCKTCIGFYGDGDFSMDEDGSDKYCRWCAQGGTLYCCASCSCTFCRKCIKRNLSRTVLVDIESEEWKCFVCDGKSLWELRAICANAQSVAKKIRRKKREENERNLKQLQKKGPPGVRKGRRLNRWQNNSAKTSGSSEEETNSSDSSQDENTRRKQSKKPSRNKRKRDSFSSSSDREITGKKKKKHVNSDAETEKECIILTDTEKEQLEMKKERSSSKKESEDDKMPNEVDPEAAKEAQDLFKEYLTELVQTGELIAYRAKRLLEKKVGDNSMTDPKHVDKIVDGINLLVKLSGENMQHTADFVNSRHKQWVKGVKRKHKHSKLNKTPTKRNSEKVTEETQKEEISGEIENGVTEENEETIHVNGALNGKVVSSVDENDKLNSDLETNNEELPSEDNEMERDTNKETKSDDNALKENETDIEINLPKKSAKRKKRSVSSEEVSDENVDSNGNGIGRDVKKKSKIDINDEDDSHHIDNNKTIDEDSCEAGIKTHTDSESDENVSSEKNNSADQDHEPNEKSNEETSLQKGATELKLNSASKHKELDSSAISITSMSTVKMDINESFDLFNDSKEEEILEKETSNTEVSKGKEEVQNEKDDSSDATIEFLNTPEPASDNSEMTEVEVRNGKKDCSSESEENTKEQNGEVCDPLSLSESVNNNFKENKVVENVTENEISNNSDSDENNLEAVDHNKVSDDEKASDIENLQLSGDDSKEDGENSVSLEAKQALLGYTSDDEAEDEDRPKKKKGRKKKTKTDNDSKVEDNSSKSLKKRRIGPKSKTKQFRSSSSSSATDEESDGSSSTKHESSKKKKFRLKDTEAYKQDKKLRWKCNVQAIKLSEDEFQKYYENYYTNESSKSEEETRDDKEILSLLNLKALKKGSGKKSQDNSNESETEESDSSDKRKKNSKPKRDKAKEQEQRLLDFFNNEDDNDTHAMSPSPNQSDREDHVTKPEMKKKTIVEKENEMARTLLLGSSSSDDEGLHESQNDEETKKKKKSKGKKVDDEASDASIDEKEPEETEDDKVKKEHEENAEKSEEENEPDAKKTEEIEHDKEEEEHKKNAEKSEEKDDDDNNKEENNDDDESNHDKKNNDEKEEKKEDDDDKEEKKEDDNEEKKDDSDEKDDEDDKEKKDKKKSNKGDSSDSESDTPKKKDWRKDKLLTEKLTDLDTSDEERLWKTKKEKEKKFEDSKKKARRRILGSDDDDDDNDDEIKISSDSSSSSDSDVFVIKKKKKKKKNSDSDVKSTDDSDSDFKSKKPKRRRIKAPASDSSSNDEDSANLKSTPGKGRKKIHHILSDDNVAEATRRAAKEEEERRKRIAEKQKMYNEIYQQVEGVEKLEKLVLDFDPETKKELVSVDTNLVQKLKPHQVKGVKFMWDACFESLSRIKKTKGSGCILAHCMGLGKTFQIVTLVHTLLNNRKTDVNTVLVVCPLSTVLNWVNEFNMWIKDGAINIFELSKYKQNYERMYQLKDWQESGGVMVIGYEMYRNLTNIQAKRLKKKAIESFQSTLVDPGPDLVVCDEGHLLKNEDSAIAKAMKRVKTLRRIVLTGTPLQNNLKEYHCMVQFVKPNLLGTRKEFLNRFVNPITNGQFEDSTPHDVKIMKRRAHVLHKMLEGSVQRFDYSVLTPFLPPKHEYALYIRLTELQVKAYRYYLDFVSKRTTENKGAQLFTDFQNLQRVFTHPRVMLMSSEREEKNKEKKRLMESDSEGSLKDFIDDDDETPESSSSSSASKASSSDDDSDVQVVDGKKETSKPGKSVRNTRSRGLPEEPEVMEVEKDEEKESPQAWWKQFVQDEDAYDDINNSGKLVLLFSILRECEKIGDKVLVFSQSLFSLNLIEYFLGKIDAATQNDENKDELGNNTGSWSFCLDYFRIDGSTSVENRNIWCKAFNREDNHRARLFLISTRAGGLGINLFAANRVILFDASWNPSHDVQSIFRVYRFGQKKPCYIYRFLAQGTMEEKIYDRQVTKLSLSCRVVDEQQIERHFNMADLQEMYQFNPEQLTKRPTPILPKDRLLAELLKEHEQWIVTYHEHDMLLENKEEEELNEEERQAAWEEYENEKKGKVLQPLPTTLPGQNINVSALRAALRNDNPHISEEQLDQKFNLIVAQIYDYLSSQQNGAPNQYTASQLQALQQYQLQQQIRAQYMEKQMRMQQGNALNTTANTYPSYNPGTTFQSYLEDQRNTTFPTNLYRNASVDKSNTFRMQQKLVPINPMTPGAPINMLQNYGNQNPSSSHTVGRNRTVLQNMPSKFPVQLAHSSGASSKVTDTSKKDTTEKPVPDDHIETID